MPAVPVVFAVFAALAALAALAGIVGWDQETASGAGDEGPAVMGLAAVAGRGAETVEVAELGHPVVGPRDTVVVLDGSLVAISIACMKPATSGVMNLFWSARSEPASEA